MPTFENYFGFVSSLTGTSTSATPFARTGEKPLVANPLIGIVEWMQYYARK
jgi:hypothetical protein